MLRKKHSEATMCEDNRKLIDGGCFLCYNSSVDEKEE